MCGSQNNAENLADDKSDWDVVPVRCTVIDVEFKDNALYIQMILCGFLPSVRRTLPHFLLLNVCTKV